MSRSALRLTEHDRAASRTIAGSPASFQEVRAWRGHGYMGVAHLFVAVLVVTPPVSAIPASPHPYQAIQPDGAIVKLYVRGDEYFHWEEDERGYTVVRDANGACVFAALDAQSNLVPTALKVGIDDPEAAGLQPTTLPPSEIRLRKRAEATELSKKHEAAAGPPPNIGIVKNVVIMMRFSNHLGRILPSNEDINIIFNHVGPHVLAPTGSVRDLYLENSYGQLTLDSSTFGWVDLPQSEQVYAAGNSGLGSNIWPAIAAALDAADPLIDFRPYDDNADGFVDAIAFIHSGYGAEWGGTDTDGTHYTNRIWSHSWTIPPWTSAEGIKVSAYHLAPGLWSTSGSDPGRIGVIAHETGHLFGLPDLYDVSQVGEGIGSWCLMANSWGFTGTQYNPPHFSAWCKEQLGWVTPKLLAPGEDYPARRVEQFPDIYKISAGFPDGEYLLLENRQPYGFESTMPPGGLAVWHIDEDRCFSDGSCSNQGGGYPGQPGWPGNDQHYRVALLQADGAYQLERGGFGRGDAMDLYRSGDVDRLDGATIPNTHAYQNGVVLATHHRIQNVSASGATMTFHLDVYVPAPGACCNDLSGACVDNVDSAACMQSGGTRFVESAACDGFSPPCVRTAPPNDDCADAISIFDGPTFFDTTLASTDGPHDCLSGDPSVGELDLWYLYRATCTGSLRVSLCAGTNYDSTLQIYEGSRCEPLGAQLGCSDDDCGVGGGPSVLVVSAIQDQDYLLRIGGWLDAVGTGFVEIKCTEILPPPLLVWHPAEGWPNTHPEAATRSLRFMVDMPVTASGSPRESALAVTMVDLQHPTPPNLPTNPPPNFTVFDTRPNGVCVGGILAGHHCDTNADCPAPGSCTGDLAACTADPACTNPAACTRPSNGCVRWVGKPGTFLESQDNAAIGSFRAARLQCTPYYADWVAETHPPSNPSCLPDVKPSCLLTVVGGEIAPSSEYSVQAYGSSCKGFEAACANVSAPVPMFTRRFGDVELPFNPPATSSQPDVTDIAQLVNKFKNVSGALMKAISQLQPNLPELNADLNALDIVAAVDGVKQLSYSFSGPCPCPSTVTCGSRECASPTPCVTAFGAGALCVKTCGGGANDGEPCINNTHCPSGTCGSGFCRDRCGRCRP